MAEMEPRAYEMVLREVVHRGIWSSWSLSDKGYRVTTVIIGKVEGFTRD